MGKIIVRWIHNESTSFGAGHISVIELAEAPINNTVSAVYLMWGKQSEVGCSVESRETHRVEPANDLMCSPVNLWQD